LHDPIIGACARSRRGTRPNHPIAQRVPSLARSLPPAQPAPAERKKLKRHFPFTALEPTRCREISDRADYVAYVAAPPLCPVKSSSALLATVKTLLLANQLNRLRHFQVNTVHVVGNSACCFVIRNDSPTRHHPFNCRLENCPRGTKHKSRVI
jgi:hypothetical protein